MLQRWFRNVSKVFEKTIEFFHDVLQRNFKKFTFNSPVRIYGIRSVSIKGQVRCIQTLVEAPSLESWKSWKFSLYFSGSCIPTNPKLSYIFPPEFLVVFNRFQCKKYQIFDEKFQILCLYFAAIAKHA
jgi:hypothetical protein